MKDQWQPRGHAGIIVCVCACWIVYSVWYFADGYITLGICKNPWNYTPQGLSAYFIPIFKIEENIDRNQDRCKLWPMNLTLLQINVIVTLKEKAALIDSGVRTLRTLRRNLFSPFQDGPTCMFRPKGFIHSVCSHVDSQPNWNIRMLEERRME